MVTWPWTKNNDPTCARWVSQRCWDRRSRLTGLMSWLQRQGVLSRHVIWSEDLRVDFSKSLGQKINRICKISPLYLGSVKLTLCVWLKNGVIPPHRKHLENSMTELSEIIADIFLLTYLLSSALMTSHRRYSVRLSLKWSRKSLVFGSNCHRRSLTKASTMSLSPWVCNSRMGVISNIWLND